MCVQIHYGSHFNAVSYMYMKRTNRGRVLIARVAIIVMAVSGVAAGYLLGCVLALQMAEYGLDQYARLMVVHEDASSVEARNLLGTLKGSPYPSCSDAEIAYFRELIFRSEYLKDAGRILGGKIVCSTTAGRPMRSIGQFKASSQKDGTIAYSNLLPVKDDHLKRAGLQLGTAYVVFGSNSPTSLGSVPMHLTVSMKEPARPNSSSPADGAHDEKGSQFTRDGARRLGDTLYATRCSTLDATCLTASATVSEALSGGSMTIAGSMVLGCGAGALLGIAFSIMYRRSRNIEQQLRRAVARDQLQVVYQPIVNLATGRIVGAEALTRWTDDEGNEVSPDVFIKVAEEHGFVSEITRMVVQRALASFAETLINRAGFRLSVNVAAADLIDIRFLSMLDDSVKRAKVKSTSLVIEITERSTADSVQAMETIRELRRRGHSIHIDDFGTGYSNLDKLLYLWADTIKIDKAFTRVIGTQSVTVAILPQILEMAKSLNLGVVVEGVEIDHQADYFVSSEEQHIYGQGWLYGHPVSAEEFHAQLANDWTKASPARKSAALLNGEVLPFPMPVPILAPSRLKA
jgi:sensor c-di-GMP phosphodiesterase-like protein